MIDYVGQHAPWSGGYRHLRFFSLAFTLVIACIGSAQAQFDTARTEISFVAPGDDGRVGVATLYDIRYSSSPINLGNWDQATPVPDVLPAPKPSGNLETITVSIPNALLGNTYYFALRTRDEAFNWSPVSNSPSFYYGLGADVGDDPTVLPDRFSLRPNYPNPFNASTRIEFDVPAPASARITIWNTLGQRVRNLVDQNLAAGVHHVLWDGTDQWGRTVPSGTYFYQLNAGDYSTTRSMTLLK